MQQQRHVWCLHSASVSSVDLVTLNFQANGTPTPCHFTTPSRLVRQFRYLHRPKTKQRTVPEGFGRSVLGFTWWQFNGYG
jgi:hypothetical protein